MGMIVLMFLGWDDDRNKQTGKRGYVTEKVMTNTCTCMFDAYVHVLVSSCILICTMP